MSAGRSGTGRTTAGDEPAVRPVRNQPQAAAVQPVGPNVPAANPSDWRQRQSAEPVPLVPARVKRQVWQRDGGQCTFVGESGQHSAARSRLEYDHVVEAARGGEATVPNLRLRCRAHNPFAAECAFGAGFMHAMREATRRAASP